MDCDRVVVPCIAWEEVSLFSLPQHPYPHISLRHLLHSALCPVNLSSPTHGQTANDYFPFLFTNRLRPYLLVRKYSTYDLRKFELFFSLSLLTFFFSIFLFNVTAIAIIQFLSKPISYAIGTLNKITIIRFIKFAMCLSNCHMIIN